MKISFACSNIVLCLMVAMSWFSAARADVAATVNIVNFVRGAEPRNPALDLVEPVREEVALNTKYGFPNTILLQYDALLRGDILEAVRAAQQDRTEYGLWFEVVQQMCERVGIKWRGRIGFSWDWFVNPGFLMAYAPQERERLVDEAMRLFREKFGAYPQSVGSWMIDAHSMDYMQRRYGVKGFCICREQDNTDAYTLRGGYFNGAYYPSKRNMLSAAVDMANAVRAPVFRMLTPDPIYNYAKSIKAINPTVCPTLEPVWQSNPQTIDWFFRVYSGPGLLNFSYMQIGQENSFGWPRIAKGLRIQLEKLAVARAEGKVVVERMCDSAEKFLRTFPENCPQTQVALEDWCGQAKSVWYNSKHYRANLLWEKGALRLRDLHKMCDGYEEPYLETACKSWKADCFTPAVVSEYLGLWDQFVAPVAFKGEFGELSVSTPDAKTLCVTAKRSGGDVVEIVFSEDSIRVSGDALAAFRGGPFRFFGCEFEVPVTRTESGVFVDMAWPRRAR